MWKYLLIFLLILGLLPAIFSLSLTKPVLEKGMSLASESEITFDSAHLGWLKGAEFKNFKVKKKKLQAQADQLSIHTPLYALSSVSLESINASFKEMKVYLKKSPLFLLSGSLNQGQLDANLKSLISHDEKTNESYPLKGHIEKKIFYLDQTIAVDLLLHNQSLRSLLPEEIFLTNPAFLKANIAKLSFPLNNPEKIQQLTAELFLKNFTLKGPSELGAVTIDSLNLTADTLENHQISFKGDVLGSDNALPLKAQFNGILNNKGKIVSGNLHGEKIPISPIAYFLNMNEKAEDLLGKSAKVDLQLTNHLYTLSLHTPTLAIEKFTFTYNDIFTLKKPAVIYVILKDFSYGKEVIFENLPAEIHLEKLAYPEVDVKGKIKTGKGTKVFVDPLGKILIDEKELRFSYKISRGQQQNISFEIDPFKGNVEWRGRKDMTFNFNGAGLLARINIQDKISLDLDINRFKLNNLKCLATLEERVLNTLEAISGPKVDGKIQLHMDQIKGNWQGKLEGEHGNFSAVGTLEKGTLLLSKPFEAKIIPSDALRASLIAELIPFLSEISDSDHPITLKIHPQGFSLPLIPFDFKQAKIAQGEILLGKLNFYGNKELGKIVALLDPKKQKNISVWFTPLYLSLNKQEILLKRVDFLAQERFPMALFGSIDLGSEEVDLTLGLTAPTLMQLLKLKSIDPNSFLEIPYQGKMGKAAIDKSKVAFQTASLIAKDMAKENQSVSKEGNILGLFLDIAGGGLQKAQIPPPTTSPLPWESQTLPK